MPVNPYCEKLGIPVPDPKTVLATAGKVKLFHLLVVTLLERGAPMTVDQVAGRLRRAGVPEVALPGGLERALVKSWHGSEPVYRLPGGRFGLNLDSHDLDFIVSILGPRPPGPDERPVPNGPLPPDSQALSKEEVITAFRGQNLYGLSALKQTAAVLDAFKIAMTPEEFETSLQNLTSSRSHLVEFRGQRWTVGLVRLTSTRLLELDWNNPALLEVRRDIRQRAQVAKARQAEEARFAAWRSESEREHARQTQEASQCRRGLLHALIDEDTVGAATVIDIEGHTIQTFIGEGLSLVGDILSRFDLLIGLQPRDASFHLDLDAAHWRIVDLASAPKSLRINRQGRTLRITPEMLIRSTTGISKPLGDLRKLRQYLAKGELGKLRRRLESDAKALYAWYRYGVLHGYVRLQWGFCG